MGNTIKKLFIANRGEIARRIAITAKRMGIECVCPLSGTAPNYLVQYIDDFAAILEDVPATYLDAELMIKLAKDHHCDAVHPGFGFLSENEGFAQKCLDSGLIWVGPKPQTISKMASKAVAREFAIAAKVPCIEGIDGINILDKDSADAKKLEAFADKAGFPLLLKAALGGGGKGMRVARSKNELVDLAIRASSEALASFGDSELICERYLENPRHIEVQILGDAHGNVYVIGDRECSIQRRHQKIVEESPAPFLDAELRDAIHGAAKGLAQAVAYESAGTVEFLVDPDQTDFSKAFFFLEMNTRLQVEHPATEEAFCLDLVEQQLRVAHGEALDFTEEDLTPKRHAIELRVYAEDPENNFLPAPGVIANFKPEIAPGIRWELGIDECDEVTGRFDPMVAKVIGFASKRQGAIDNLIHGLKHTVFAGPKNNLKYLLTIMQHEHFQSEVSTTKYIELFHEQHLNTIQNQVAQKTAKEILDELASDSMTVAPSSETRHAQHFSNAFSRDTQYKNSWESQPKVLPPQTKFFGDHKINISRGSYPNPEGNANTHFYFTEMQNSLHNHKWVHVDGYAAHTTQSFDEPEFNGDSSGSRDSLKAPVPGKIITISKSQNDTVNEGEVIMVLESMKMEFEIKSPQTGKIAQILVETGKQVSAGDSLIQWSED